MNCVEDTRNLCHFGRPPAIALMTESTDIWDRCGCCSLPVQTCPL